MRQCTFLQMLTDDGEDTQLLHGCSSHADRGLLQVLRAVMLLLPAMLVNLFHDLALDRAFTRAGLAEAPSVPQGASPKCTQH